MMTFYFYDKSLTTSSKNTKYLLQNLCNKMSNFVIIKITCSMTLKMFTSLIIMKIKRSRMESYLKKVPYVIFIQLKLSIIWLCVSLQLRNRICFIFGFSLCDTHYKRECENVLQNLGESCKYMFLYIPNENVGCNKVFFKSSTRRTFYHTTQCSSNRFLEVNNWNKKLLE